MSESMERYRCFERKLKFLRFCHNGFESIEEDALLEEMDEAWWKLTDRERETLYSEGPKTLLRTDVNDSTDTGWIDIDIGTHPDKSVRKVA